MLDEDDAGVVRPGVVVLVGRAVAPHRDHVPELVAQAVEEELAVPRRRREALGVDDREVDLRVPRELRGEVRRPDAGASRPSDPSERVLRRRISRATAPRR